jgi:histone deacetylase 11
MVPLVYSPGYNITAFGLERLHPFDSLKYRRIHDWLVRQGLRKPADFVRPRPVSRADLLRVHTAEYLRTLRDRRVLAGILEVPPVRYLPAWMTDWRVLRPMRRAAGGTVLACRLAAERGLAINLGGGYHHASGSRGGGFSVYADGPLGLHFLREGGRFRTVLVVDTDAHQGDGTADAVRQWAGVFVLDFYQDPLFPFPKVVEDMPVPLPPWTQGAAYLDWLRAKLPLALDRYRPEFVLYNAGSDVLRDDPLTHLELTPAEMAERDLYVVTEVRERGVPLAILLSGGYGPASWRAHAESIEGILTRFDREI